MTSPYIAHEAKRLGIGKLSEYELWGTHTGNALEEAYRRGPALSIKVRVFGVLMVLAVVGIALVGVSHI